MANGYAEDHAGALADVTDAGAAAPFTLTTAGTYDGATDTWITPPVTTTVNGSAVEVDEDAEEYQALSLVHTIVRALFFTPTTYGSLPVAGYSVSWASTLMTAKKVKPLAPDGRAIGAVIWVVA